MQGVRTSESGRRVKPVDSGPHPRVRERKDEDFAGELARRKQDATDDPPSSNEDEVEDGVLRPDKVEIHGCPEMEGKTGRTGQQEQEADEDASGRLDLRA